MNIPRLLKVIEAVANTPPKLFSMRCWGQITECGTIGCAIGRYIIDNPRCGLRLYWEKDFQTACIYGSLGTSCYFIQLIAKHFKISGHDVAYLFLPGSYDRPTKANVLRRLRAFVKGIK